MTRWHLNRDAFYLSGLLYGGFMYGSFVLACRSV